MSLIATHSGLRGRPGAELTGKLVEQTVQGLVELVRRRKLSPRLGVARDERPDSDALAAQVVEAALDCGADVVDFGVAPTPAARLAARARGLGGVVVVTGSHLEPQLNGLKLAAGPAFGPVDVRALPRPTGRTAPVRGQLRSDAGAVEEHVAAVAASVDPQLIASAGLSVSAHEGAGPGPALLLDRLGCAAGDRAPDVQLRLDADADRLTLADEQARDLDAECTLALTLLARDARRVVKGADTSRLVDDVAEAQGARVWTVSPGELHLHEQLRRAGGDLAGEGNGGVIVPAVGPGRDGLAAAAAILQLLARRATTLSSLAAELPSYQRRRSTLPCPHPDRSADQLARLCLRLGRPHADAHTGIRLASEDDAWGLLRLSATEPVWRVTVEARTQPAADALHDELRAMLLEATSAS